MHNQCAPDPLGIPTTALLDQRLLDMPSKRLAGRKGEVIKSSRSEANRLNEQTNMLHLS
ncbi:hypothetical protein T03_17167 [Trichinella britovi]|uniref:Uncharacterized protein n=1 Tax=Trichinella britovi TaxID=45882 RepID=A0A0V1C9D3_TRIBR|nr:hypothetical protein T03_17167 [Trichinella britovi]